LLSSHALSQGELLSQANGFPGSGSDISKARQEARDTDFAPANLIVERDPEPDELLESFYGLSRDGEDCEDSHEPSEREQETIGSPAGTFDLACLTLELLRDQTFPASATKLRQGALGNDLALDQSLCLSLATEVRSLSPDTLLFRG